MVRQHVRRFEAKEFTDLHDPGEFGVYLDIAPGAHRFKAFLEIG